MRIVVIRTGSTWWGRNAPQRPSVLQSQDNHTAVARAIRDGGHNVLCVGRIVGDMPEGCSALSWLIKLDLKRGPSGEPDGTVDDSTIDRNSDEIRRIVTTIADWRPDVLVQVCGSEITTLSPKTCLLRGVSTYKTLYLYCWPLVEILQELRLPRICVVTDVRCYPRESELDVLGSFMTPRAVLSQQEARWRQRVLSSTFEIRAKYAQIERLRMCEIRPMRPDPTARGCVAVANSHMRAARIDKNKRELWQWIARDQVIDAYGDGWTEPPGMICPKGVLPHEQIYPTMNRYACGPLVPMLHGWVSPKYREYAVAGCLPLPYGRATTNGSGRVEPDLLTYDFSDLLGEGHVVPINSSTRFNDPAELTQLVHRCELDPAWREEQLELALERSDPRESSKLLLEAIEHFGRGGAVDIERFGGYTRLEA